MAIDQDPYFRMTRDVAVKLKLHKPSLIHSKFFPALQGDKTKMSSSVNSTSIFLTDKPEDISNKIKKYAKSGGRDTLEEHKKYGGDPIQDTSFQYLKFFLEDDEKLAQIAEDYQKGKLLTSELKKFCVEEISKVVETHKKKK